MLEASRDGRADLEQVLVVPSGLLFGFVGDGSMPALVVGGDAGLLSLLAGKGRGATTYGRFAFGGGSAAWCGMVQGLAWWSPDGDGVAPVA
ncbi:hypothetical protein M0R45_028310 [Rubus argutus]|uniref:Uncharacterized protein n=1 Tax=Rubus argutus TaxID=59490 RepID=A0AAW1W488_RUBAR